MVWPRDHRRQMPFGRRQIPFITPPQLQQAPLELLRSHLYPIDPRQMAPAVQQGAAGNYPVTYWLPLRMGQQQWKKQNGFYPPQLSMARAFMPVQAQMAGDSGTMYRTARQHVPPHPTLPWNVLAGELNAQMDLSREGGLMRHPIGRGIPSPMRWPSETFETMTDMEDLARATWQERHHRARMRSMRRLRRLDAEYGRFTEPLR